MTAFVVITDASDFNFRRFLLYIMISLLTRNNSTRRTLEELRESDKPRRIPSWKRHLNEKKKNAVKVM